MLTTLNIPMDAQVITAYNAAPEMEKQRINQLLEMIVVSTLQRPKRTREDMLILMNEMGQMAQENGLTEELLAEILAEIDTEGRIAKGNTQQ